MKKTLMVLAGAALVAGIAGGAFAQEKKSLAVVVKGLDNPFFTILGQGCADWNTENPDSEYTCFFTGPALSSDEAGEIQIVQDLIARDVAGLAISPSNAPAMGKMLREANPPMPIIAVDGEFLQEDMDLIGTFFGSNGYDIGVGQAKELMRLKPEGGTVCLQYGNPAAENINIRGRGFLDTIAGVKDTKELTGQNGWTQVEGCPLYTNDDIALSNQQLSDVLTAHPDLDAFVGLGGWAMFGPEAYRATTDQVMDRIKANDLILLFADAIPVQRELFREGRAHYLIAQRPSQMGHDSPELLIRMINGETLPTPIYADFDLCTVEDIGFCANP
jgi:ribose transport system substrate-binding protein